MTLQTISPQEIKGRFELWWQVPGVEEIDSAVRALNAQALTLAPMPVWASQVRGAMPRWGMEMCAHRWVDGLETLIASIGQDQQIATEAGRCGDMPARVLAGAQARAMGLERWLQGRPPRTACERDVMCRLGPLTDARRTAGEGMLSLVRAALWGDLDQEAWATLVAEWRGRAEEDALLEQVLGDYALVDSLENACGFMLLYRLDWALDLIGGDDRHDEEPGGLERLGNCNAQLRLMWEYDPLRYVVTRGYLWGLRAWLDGRDEAWLRAEKPDCAPAAIWVMRQLGTQIADLSLRRWLVESLLVTTLLWAQRAVRLSEKGFAAPGAPEWAHDLPEIDLALEVS